MVGTNLLQASGVIAIAGVVVADVVDARRLRRRRQGKRLRFLLRADRPAKDPKLTRRRK